MRAQDISEYAQLEREMQHLQSRIYEIQDRMQIIEQQAERLNPYDANDLQLLEEILDMPAWAETKARMMLYEKKQKMGQEFAKYAGDFEMEIQIEYELSNEEIKKIRKELLDRMLHGETEIAESETYLQEFRKYARRYVKNKRDWS